MAVIYDKLTNKKKAFWHLVRPYIIAALPAALLIAIYFIFRGNKQFASVIVDYFAIPVRSFLGWVCSFVPVSVTEIVYIAVAVFVLYFIVRSVVLIIYSDFRWEMLLRRILLAVLIGLYYFASLCFIWKFDYCSPTFAEKAGLSTDSFTTEELISVTEQFVAKASELAGQVKRDKKGNYVEDVLDEFDAYDSVYNFVQDEFPVLDGKLYKPKQMRLFSEIMSRTGFTGIYVAYTGESNININVPAYTMPCTIGHELAHQLGVYAEDEANFVGMLACITSGNTIYEYSGYFGASIHLMNALYKVDKEAWQEIRDSFSEEMLHDWNANNEYWRSKESSVSEAASDVYDKYLKSNGQTGVVSYSQCVLLLVNYFAK